MSKNNRTAGAQNMRRALQILRALGKQHIDGMTVNEVMDATQLERSTTHRLLTCLVEEQFADREAGSRRYRLGLDAMHLGYASLGRAPLVATYEGLLTRLARISEDTVFLLVRCGDYTVCHLRADGSFPVKIFSTRVGDIRPLGIGVGGMALLATASDEEIERIRCRHARAFDAAGLTQRAIARVVGKSRKIGFAELEDSVTEGVTGVGAVIPVSSGSPFAAISIASINPRMMPPRRAELGKLLLDNLNEKPG